MPRLSLCIALLVAGCAKREPPAPVSPVAETGCRAADPAACHASGNAHLQAELLDLAAAARDFEIGCENGHFLSCSALGLLYQDGRGVAHDDARAEALYEKACGGGAGVGCYNLGLLHADEPERAKVEYERAAAAYQRSCAAGELAWCMNLGVLYEKGHGVTADRAEAARIYRDACDRGHGDSCGNLAALQGSGPEGPIDLPGTVALADRACGGGSAVACTVYAQLMLRGGPGLLLDKERVLDALRKACSGGVGYGCGVLGAVYGLGDLVPADDAKAHHFQARACALGQSDACFVQAQVALEGGPAPDFEGAARWFERACNIGHGEACGMLGGLHQLGRGVPADEIRAEALFVEGCRRGDGGSCVELLRRGAVLPLDGERRWQFLQSACAAGVVEACKAQR